MEEAGRLGIAGRGRVVVGNWRGGEEGGELCEGQVYDVILADYLVGAIVSLGIYYCVLLGLGVKAFDFGRKICLANRFGYNQ